jgi:DNA-binding transcriptional MerR regulator
VGEGRTGADGRADERLTLREAAARLGVSESAIRKRVERGTLRSDKGPDGKRYVYLDTVADNMTDRVSDASGRDVLISEMQSHIEDLRNQLAAERQSSAELRRIVAALTSRIPELPAASSERPPEGPVTTTDKPESTSARSEEGAQEGAQRPWWRRMFGG